MKRKNWKIFSQYMEIRSDSIKVDSTRVDSWMDSLDLNLLFMIGCQHCKRNNHLRKYLSCYSTLDRYHASHSIFSIEPNLYIIHQFYPGDLANFAVSTIIFFFIAALIIRWFGQVAALSRRTCLQLFLRYFFI